MDFVPTSLGFRYSSLSSTRFTIRATIYSANMTLHLSFAFALAFLFVSVLSSAFDGPKATLAVNDEASLADGWTPRPTSGPVLRNIRRRTTQNVLTELRALPKVSR
jgi:hypothetical protein